MPGHYARPVVTETDLKLRDGRTLHVYDSAGEDGGQNRLAVFWQHRCSLPPTGSASAGCRTTGPATAGRPRSRAEA